jgi:hypothetical protein
MFCHHVSQLTSTFTTESLQGTWYSTLPQMKTAHRNYGMRRKLPHTAGIALHFHFHYECLPMQFLDLLVDYINSTLALYVHLEAWFSQGFLDEIFY